MEKKDFGIIFWVHLLIILAIYSSPFWVDWKIIAVGIGVYYLQLILFKNCILTTLQFNEKERDTTFYSYYLTKLGFNINKTKLRLFLDYIMPWLILAVALPWQKLR